MKEPIPCPWEEDCSSCVRRSTCPTWMDYVENCNIVSEMIENGNLSIPVDIPVNVRRDMQFLPGWHDPLRGFIVAPPGTHSSHEE